MRPDSKARLELEISGAVENPTLEIACHSSTFPTTIREGQRLICRDGRKWQVIDSTRQSIAQGALENPLPSLSGGSHQLRFKGSGLARPLIKLTKVYD